MKHSVSRPGSHSRPVPDLSMGYGSVHRSPHWILPPSQRRSFPPADAFRWLRTSFASLDLAGIAMSVLLSKDDLAQALSCAMERRT